MGAEGYFTLVRRLSSVIISLMRSSTDCDGFDIIDHRRLSLPEIMAKA